jgi:large subunit ribosomal protein L5
MSDDVKAEVTEIADAAKASADAVIKPEKKPRVAKQPGAETAEKVAKPEGGEKAAPKEQKAPAKQEAGEKAAAPKGDKPVAPKGDKGAPAGKGGDKSSGEKQGKKPSEPKPKEIPVVPRLKVLYKETIAPELFKERGYKSVMQVPKISKIVVSMGIGEATSNKKLLDAAVTDLSAITGQHAVKTKAKKSIANFKLREGNEVGVMVTLRGAHMYEFLDRLVNVALPRVKDFRGVKASGFDGHGNYSLGITEQIIFPEIDFDKIERIAGLNINIVTTAETDADARALLDKFRMPFRK